MYLQKWVPSFLKIWFCIYVLQMFKQDQMYSDLKTCFGSCNKKLSTKPPPKIVWKTFLKNHWVSLPKSPKNGSCMLPEHLFLLIGSLLWKCGRFVFPFIFQLLQPMARRIILYAIAIICMVIAQKIEVSFQNTAVQLCALHNLLTLETADYTSFSWHQYKIGHNWMTS